jgi:hypothetical protein
MFLLAHATAWAADFGVITGTIHAADGRPVVDAVVFVVGTQLGVKTDARGRFKILPVPAGDRRIQIRAQMRKPIELPIRVHSGVNALGVIVLKPEMPGPTRAHTFALGIDCMNGDDTPGRPIQLLEDSTRTWGSCSIQLVPAPIWFGCAPKQALARLAILVLDGQGRLIRRLRDGAASSFSAKSWDGRDEAGRETPLGAYRARFVTETDSVEIPFCRGLERLPGWLQSPRDSPIERILNPGEWHVRQARGASASR